MKTDLLFDVPFPGHEEDAPPVADDRLAIVCDGLGGAGGVEFKVDGEVHTCAYYASRAVIAIAEGFLRENHALAFSDGMSHLDQMAADLERTVRKGLQDYSDRTGISFKGRKSGGSMVKLLPTTLASCIYKDMGDRVDVICFWAGDSRCYALDRSGLHQLTDDDARGYIDAMECIIQDAVMTNVICLDHDFHIRWKAYSVPKPCFVFAASDGCFAYLDSPMSFESLFLPRTDREFDLESSIQGSLEAHENDDRTLAGHIFGISTEEEYREAFCPRGDEMESEYISKMVLTERIDELRRRRNEMGSRELSEEEKSEYSEVKSELKSLRKQNEDLMRSLWSGYSKGYLLDPLSPEQLPVVVPEEPAAEEKPPEPASEPEKAAETEPEAPDATAPADDGKKAESAKRPEPAPTVPGMACGKEWTLPKREVKDSGVAYIMPYTLNRDFVFSIRKSRMICGHPIVNNWFRSGDCLSTVCDRGSSPRNVRRLFVKKRDKYDIVRDTEIIGMIQEMNTDGRFMLPSERYMPTGEYVQTFMCSQSGAESLDGIRRFSDSKKARLMMEICRSVKILHDAGLVHGSISPESVVIVQTPRMDLRPIICNYCDMFIAEDAKKLDRIDPAERGPWYDVYCLGLLFYKIYVHDQSDERIVSEVNIYRKGSAKKWIMELIAPMLDENPSKRPDISQVMDEIAHSSRDRRPDIGRWP
ncbi:MAG: protein phosphatase 2C domain-containing protein [Candidatus Methanomethylophilaceae archaeon]|nr:protein phosphatase 2C domain-containing protein [Candidatus Methanomethylophilaceae archaeon]